MKQFLYAFIIIGLCSCVSYTKPATDSIPALSRLIQADNDFGFRIFGRLTDNNPQTNIFISPTSIQMCLRMLYNGASGKTKTAISKTLGLSELTLSQTNQANLELSEQLKSTDEKVVLNIANSLWAQQGIEFKKDFLESNQTYYNAEIATLNFADQKSPATINQWADDKTNGKITQVVQELDPSMVMILINAIYFNGKWTIEFDTTKTKELPFTLPDNTQKQVLMMIQDGNYRYFENEKIQAIGLPYGNKRMSMYIFLPKAVNGLADFVAGLNEKTWSEYVANFRYHEGDIFLPRFKFEYEKTLNQALIDLGMTNTFSNADFTNLTDIPAFVSGVVHKTFVEVNEAGTEAAAVTSVFIATAIADQPKPFSMICDHPFFCAIVDDQTGSILFMGAVTNPQ
ncbi:MAG: serpin family protein [Candidatus Latescibacteria bacterium]|nr:serpin family protein [Candidatus Latescibacterota bacterium]